MPYKRILLFSLLFLILAVSLFYYVLPRVLYPLRKDTVPIGAYIVPWMQPNPSIEELKLHEQQPYGPPTFDIDSVMSNALKLSITFNITVPEDTRVIPSTIYLGHDSDYLYVGGKFQNMGLNPASTPDRTVPHIFSIFLDVVNDGVLRQPESGSMFAAYITENWGGGRTYEDAVWVNYAQQSKRAIWLPSGNYLAYEVGKPQTIWSLKAQIHEYDNSTQTVTMLFSRLLSCSGNAEVNAFQMRPDECWVMGFLIELSYVTNSPTGNYVDGWPKNIYPYLSSNSSWWPKIAINLTNSTPT
jgi:hypothetical protein